MLIKFKSKSSPEIMMYQEHAQRILDLLHKSPVRGVITAAEVEHALETLENEVSLSRHDPLHDVEHDIHAHKQDDSENLEHATAQHVGFAARAFPLLEMLRAAKADGHDIVWGI